MKALRESLIEAERAYIRNTAVIDYCVDPNWPPFEVVNAKGAHIEVVRPNPRKLQSHRISQCPSIF